MTQTENSGGWTATTYPQPNGTFKVICISPDRKRVVHIDRLNATQAAAVDPNTVWGASKVKPAKNDVMADLMASVDAVKASKAVA